MFVQFAVSTSLTTARPWVTFFSTFALEMLWCNSLKKNATAVQLFALIGQLKAAAAACQSADAQLWLLYVGQHWEQNFTKKGIPSLMTCHFESRKDIMTKFKSQALHDIRIKY